MSKTIELARHLETLHINDMYKTDFYWTWDKTDDEIDAVFTVADALRDRSFPLVVDPVSVSQSGSRLLREDAVEALKERMIPGCDLLTPNRPEAEMLTGMTISVVKKTRDGHFADALWDEITWWVILAGGAMALLKVGSVAGVPVVLVIGVLMLVYGSGRGKKGFGKVTGLVSAVYNGVTGFFSDILSYVRLMALMLSGAVLAQVFNMLGATTGNVVGFVVIALIGNALNLALNLLGCYVHDMRLQFLEFFGRFYKEGGKSYRPLSVETQYVEVMKEDN